MGITVTNINTGGAVVTIGGTVNGADGDGYYIGTTGGTDIGCTQGGITMNYSNEVTEIFCDQTLAAVSAAITSETAEIEMEMLESNAENLRFAIGQYVSNDDASNKKTAVGGYATVQYVPLMMEVPKSNDPGKQVTWTFYKIRPQGPEVNFERENPTAISVTFSAYAETSYPSGHQLFSIDEEI
jgi:hypothetical protein